MLLVSIGLLLVMGCGSNRGSGGSVSGTITYNGRPVNGATLQFIPQSSENGKKVIRVPVSQEGTFRGFDLPPGEYKIVVEGQVIPPMAPPKGADEEVKQKFEQAHSQDVSTIPFPKKYKSVQTTDLIITIKAGEKQNLTLDLKD